MQSDAVYFRARARDEIDAAMAAKRTPARKAHLELAQRYVQLADAIECQERRIGLASISAAEQLDSDSQIV